MCVGKWGTSVRCQGTEGSKVDEKVRKGNIAAKKSLKQIWRPLRGQACLHFSL